MHPSIIQARVALVLLTLGDLATTLPQASGEGFPSVIVIEHAGSGAYVAARLAITLAGMAGLAIVGRLWPVLEWYALTIVSGALVAAVIWNLAFR